ncbi:MAG: tetratricopeptide repeat protein [Acetobacteraceae bacterium]|nr:tetratricopeptide repeat protein [Acetobacteraceae bacterium]
MVLAGLLAAALAAGGTRSEVRDADANARLRIAQVAEQSGRPDLALNLLASAAEAAPNDPLVQERYANALSRAGRYPEAEVVPQAALRIAPTNPEVHVAMGRLRVREDRLQEALSHFERAAALSPRLVAALDGQGVVLDHLGRHEEAHRAYRAALDIAGDDPVVANNLALSLLLTGRAEEAVALLQPLANRPDVTPRIENNLAIALAAAGRANEGAAVSPEGMTAANLEALSRALASPPRGEAPRPGASGGWAPAPAQPQPLPPVIDAAGQARPVVLLPPPPAAENFPAPAPPLPPRAQRRAGAMADQGMRFDSAARPEGEEGVAAPPSSEGGFAADERRAVRVASLDPMLPDAALGDRPALSQAMPMVAPGTERERGEARFYAQFSAHRSEQVAAVSLRRMRALRRVGGRRRRERAARRKLCGGRRLARPVARFRFSRRSAGCLQPRASRRLVLLHRPVVMQRRGT